jgi:TetR/AcrR family transcriptional regulator
MIWATTQHYADFDVQVRAVLGRQATGSDHFNRARTALEQVFLKGIAPAS